MDRHIMTDAEAGNLTVGDMVVMPGDGGDIVAVVKDGGKAGGAETDLYLAYICHVGDDQYTDAYDSLPYLQEDTTLDNISR